MLVSTLDAHGAVRGFRGDASVFWKIEEEEGGVRLAVSPATTTMPTALAARMVRRGCRLALPLERRLLQSKQRHGITLRLHSTSSSEATATSVLANNVDANSADFEANRAHMSGLIADLDKLQGRIALGGPEKARLRHVGRGKMLARDRVGALLDPGSPFIEVGNLAGWNLYESEGEDAVPCAGVVAGIGLVEG